MPVSITATRARKLFRKTITFTNAAGSGAIGTVAVGTVTGACNIDLLNVRCTTGLAGATATIEMGIAGTTNGLIAQAVATNLAAGLQWSGATPAKIVTPVINKVVDDDIIITVGTANLTAGVVEVEMYYVPLSVDGYIA